MANRTATLYASTKLSTGWTFKPLPRNPIDLQAPNHYRLFWYEQGKRKSQAVGRYYAIARAAQVRKEAELKGVPVNDSKPAPESRVTLANAIAAYLEEKKLAKKKSKTLAAYTTALNYFQESCTKVYLHEIDRLDMLKFHTFLSDTKGQSPRSCWNKFSNVMGFLKGQGVKGLVKKEDWPSYVEEEPEIYEPEELETFFDACNDEERHWFGFFLMTGMREQEVIYSDWKNFNPKKRTVTVKHNPKYDWTPKAYKERHIPIPESLVNSLIPMMGSGLMFPTTGGKPKTDFLEVCKAIAKRAGARS